MCDSDNKTYNRVRQLSQNSLYQSSLFGEDSTNQKAESNHLFQAEPFLNHLVFIRCLGPFFSRRQTPICIVCVYAWTRKTVISRTGLEWFRKASEILSKVIICSFACVENDWIEHKSSKIDQNKTVFRPGVWVFTLLGHAQAHVGKEGHK